MADIKIFWNLRNKTPMIIGCDQRVKNIPKRAQSARFHMGHFIKKAKRLFYDEVLRYLVEDCQKIYLQFLRAVSVVLMRPTPVRLLHFLHCATLSLPVSPISGNTFQSCWTDSG